MKMLRYYLALTLALEIFCLNADSAIYQKQDILTCHSVLAFSRAAFFSINSQRESNFDRQHFSHEMEPFIKYLAAATSPFRLSDIPLDLLHTAKEKNNQVSIRNGNWIEAESAFKQYQLLLNQFLDFCGTLHLSPDIDRKSFFHLRKECSQNENKVVWKKFNQQRTELKKAFKTSKRQLKLALSTEKVLKEQYLHFPELYGHLKQLCNLDGSPLPVYITSYPNLAMNLSDRLIGLTIVIQQEGVFTSHTPKFKKNYPTLRGRNKAITIHLKEGVGGQVLSHEFGHLYYLYHHWQEYQSYIKSQGKAYKVGGHGVNDPSGEAALRAEKRIMPD